MEVLRSVLDGLAMSLVFNMTVGLFWYIMPHAYSIMLPKEIKEKAGIVTKKEKLKLASWIYPLFIGIIIWTALSIKSSEIVGFWNIFWSAYIVIFCINIGDFVILDCLLRKCVRDKDMIKGTKDLKVWNIKEWMKSAIPEHFIFYPLIICPLFSLIVWLIAK